MRMTLLLAAAATALTMGATATQPGFTLPQNFDPWNVNFCYSISQLNEAASAMGANPGKGTPKKQSLKSIKKANAEKHTYFIAAQTFHKNYAFNYNGGAVRTYNIEVTIDGDQATISNFFDLAAQSTEWSVGVDKDVVGKYDAEAKTITIPTSQNFEDATIAGTIGDSYTELLVCGTVNESGQMAPDQELVLYLDDDMNHIYSKQHIGSMHYFTSMGMSYGMQYTYRSFEGFAPSEKPHILSYNSSFNMGEAYIGTEGSVEATYVNVSSAPADYAITLEADDNAFTATPAAGVAEALSQFNVVYNFKPAKEGEYEGIATINYEGASESGDPIVVLLTGSAIPYPDYSAIVKEGQMSFTTNIEHPFEITTDADGNTIARSTLGGQTGTSQLTVSFDVPEGNIGTFAWKGNSNNSSDWYKCAGGYFIDDAPSAAQSWTGPDTDITGSLQFTPGHHSVRFQFEANYYTGLAENALSVYDLSLTSAKAEPDAAELQTPAIDLGAYMIKPDNKTVNGTGTIRLINKGSNPLKVNSITSDNSKFSGTAPQATAGLLETLDVPVTFESSEAGTFEANITVNTSAGSFTAKATAIVRELADFSALVTEGAEYVTSFTTNEAAPFEIKDGVVYNANAGLADTQYVDSWLRVSFTVPEGKAARLEWDGHSYAGVQPDAEWEWQGDYVMHEFYHPMTSGSRQVYGYDKDASSKVVAEDEAWKDQLVCVPGNHYITFHYVKNGDGFISEEDRAEFSNLKIKIEDFPEHGCRPDKEEVTFEPTYVGDGRYTTAVINLRNTGSQALTITGTRSQEGQPFYGTFREGDQAQWNRDIEVGIWFYPAQEGKYEGDVVFETNAGDITIHCIGETKSAEGLLLIGDFEDSANGWTLYDADKDGYCWDLGTNLWGERPEWVHSGKQCLASASQDPNGGALAPDNWTISPVITMPEDGKAMLTWWVAAHHSTRYNEHYSVYFAKTDDVQDPEKLSTLTPVYSETLKESDGKEWRQLTQEVSGTPGEKYCVAFRHHDCSAEYVFKLDDVFLYTMDQWNKVNSVNDMFADTDVVAVEYYDINGIRLSAPTEGVNIVTLVYSDGHRDTRKVMITK